MSIVDERPVATGQDVLRTVTRLAAGFRDRRLATAVERSVPRESIDELVEAGAARLLVPREQGGLDGRVRDLVEVTAAAAFGCPSTGWLTGLMAHVSHVVGLFPLPAQEAVWSQGPDVVMAGAFMGAKAKVVPGGYRLSGSSPFASGVNSAEWVYLAGLVTRPGQTPQYRLFLMPNSQYTVVDTWRTAGMRGTGSNTVVTEDVFVPEAFTLSHEDAREGSTPGSRVNANPSFALPWVATGAFVFSSARLGAAEGAYADAFAALVNKRGPGGVRTADSEVLQIQVSFIAARIETARTVLGALADRADLGSPYTLLERARSMRDNTFAAMLLVEAVDGLLEISGTAGFLSTSVIQRAWRDVHFAAAHQGLDKRATGGRYGRVALGVAEVAPPIFYRPRQARLPRRTTRLHCRRAPCSSSRQRTSS